MLFKHFSKTLMIVLVCVTSLINISAHSATVLSGLNGTYSWLPEEKKKYSPLHGVVMVHNGELKKLYDREKGDPVGDITKLLFYELFGNIKVTQLYEQAAFKLSNRLIYTIIKHLEKPKESFSPLLENKLFKEDITNSLQFSSKNQKKAFNRFIKKLLLLLDTVNLNENKKTIRNLFISFIYIRSKTNTDLKRFISLFLDDEEKEKPHMKPDNLFHKEDVKVLEKLKNHNYFFNGPLLIDLEEVVYSLAIEKLPKFDFLHISSPAGALYKKNHFQNCIEDVVQTIINTFLYDPEQNKLSFDHLSQDIRVDQKFKNFVEKYAYPIHWGEQKETMINDWAEVVSNIPNIVYLKENYEIKSDKKNVLTLLSYLFGLKSIENFSDFTQKISSDTKEIITIEHKEMPPHIIILQIKNISETYPLELQLMFALQDRHGEIHFYTGEKNEINSILLSCLIDISKVYSINLANMINPDNLNFKVFYDAIKSNDISVIEFLIKNRYQIDNEALKSVIDIKNENFVEKILEQGIVPNDSHLASAIEKGSTKIVDLLLRYKVHYGERTLNTLIKRKDKKLLSQILKNKGEGSKIFSLKIAQETKEDDLIPFLLKEGCQIDQASLQKIIESKDQDMLKLLIKYGNQTYNYSSLETAVWSQDEEILSLTLKLTPDISSNDLHIAILRKNKRMVSLLIQKGVEPNEKLLKIAKQINDPEIIDLIESAMKK